MSSDKTAGLLPKVSIMIPTYGQEDVVLDAVNSALAQDYPNLEVIVADDASPDHTGEVIAARSDPRLRYHRNNANLGRVGNYRNTLYNLVKGEWVVNLDGDDFFTDPGFVSAAIERVMNDPEIVIVAARGHRGSSSKDRNNGPGNATLPGIIVIKNIRDTAYHFYHLATLYNRRLAIGLDFYREDVMSSDWESLYRLAAIGKVAFLDRDVGVWRKSIMNACDTADISQWTQNLRIWKSIFTSAASAGMDVKEAETLKRRVQLDFAYLGFSRLCDLRGAAVLREYLVASRAVIGWSGLAALLTDWRVVGKFVLGVLKSGRPVSPDKERDR